MRREITLYHGSSKIIREPIFGFGNHYNDYGQGFYCTPLIDLAKEWACTEQLDGFANEYRLSLDGMSILNLLDNDYNILNWLAVLLDNRIFKTTGAPALEGKDYLIKNFLPDYKFYDIIKGYRADDSYFAFASAFLNNTISLDQLEAALYYGNLGEQIVLKSEKAFARLQYVGNHLAQGISYYPKRLKRDSDARLAYQKSLSNSSAIDDIYLIDIIRGRWTKDDSRIQRIVLK